MAPQKLSLSFLHVGAKLAQLLREWSQLCQAKGILRATMGMTAATSHSLASVLSQWLRTEAKHTNQPQSLFHGGTDTMA